MEYAASRPAPRGNGEIASKRRRRRVRVGSAVLAAACLATLIAPTREASASPKPDIDEMRRRADRLTTRLERLTEQYDGLRVRMEQALRASQIARASARRESRALRDLQTRIGRLAAQRYMHGGGQSAAFWGEGDPQALLDRAATLHYFTQQDNTEVAQITRAVQSAERARASAEDRAAQAAWYRTQVGRQRAKIKKILGRLSRPLLKDAIARAGRGEPVPPIPGGPGKAVGAVRAALSQLGVPYVWGGASPRPGFDCSGLTMWAYKQVGVRLPHYGGDQWNVGRHVPKNRLRPGDLVFFYPDIHHMGMYIGDGKFVHAPHTGDHVRVSNLTDRPFTGAVRVV